MDPQLLEKEKNYRKLNFELEQRTKELIKEVNSIYAKINSKNPSTNTTVDTDEASKSKVSHGSTTGKMSGSHCYSIRESKPSKTSRKHSGTHNNDNRLLQTKVQILQTELHEMRSWYVEKVKDCSVLESSLRKLIKEVGDIKRSLNKVKQVKAECENNYLTAVKTMEGFENENKTLKTEIEMLHKELKHTKKKDAIQLKQLLDEIERLNEKCAKAHDTRFRRFHSENEVSKKMTETAGLLKKQLELVVNLKKQKLILETIKPLNFCENKFLKLFNMDS